jgi:hypothetical protein
VIVFRLQGGVCGVRVHQRLDLDRLSFGIKLGMSGEQVGAIDGFNECDLMTLIFVSIKDIDAGIKDVGAAIFGGFSLSDPDERKPFFNQVFAQEQGQEWTATGKLESCGEAGLPKGIIENQVLIIHLAPDERRSQCFEIVKSKNQPADVNAGCGKMKPVHAASSRGVRSLVLYLL